METICAKCSEKQRYKCRSNEHGCDDFYKWRDKVIDLLLGLGKEKIPDGK